jgi:hypothetical protein
MWIFKKLGLILLICGSLTNTTHAATKTKSVENALNAMRVVIVRSSDSLCEPHCAEWIYAEGDITAATPEAFRAVFRKLAKKKLPVVLNSNGGSIDHALIIGEMLRARKLTTTVAKTNFSGCLPNDKTCKLPKSQNGIYRGQLATVNARCNSACPLLLAGGVTRYVSTSASIGLHQPKITRHFERIYYTEKYRIVKGKRKVISKTIQSRKKLPSKISYGYSKTLKKRLSAYYKKMGVDPRIVTESEKAEYQSMLFLKTPQLRELKIATSFLPFELTALNNPCKNLAKIDYCVTSDVLPVVSGAAATTLTQSELSKHVLWIRDSRSECEPTCPEWLMINGELGEPVVADFERMIPRLKGKKLPVALNSTGGSLDSAIQLGRYIHALGLDTIVASFHLRPCKSDEKTCAAQGVIEPAIGFVMNFAVCNSACIAALAGGRERQIGGEHSLASENPNAFSRVGNLKKPTSALSQHLSDLGIKPTLMFELWKNTKKQVASVDFAVVQSSGLATAVENPDKVLNPKNCKINPSARYCFKSE